MSFFAYRTISFLCNLGVTIDPAVLSTVICVVTGW
jgi:hypothetical protein